MASADIQTEKEKKRRRLNKSSKIFKVIIRAIQDRKGENILSVDLRKIPEAVADYFILSDVTSSLQARAIAEHVEELVYKELGERPYRSEGQSALKWVILDYVDIVVHLFLKEERIFYNLEEMWEDAKQEKF